MMYLANEKYLDKYGLQRYHNKVKTKINEIDNKININNTNTNNRISNIESNIYDNSMTTLSTNANLTSLTGVVDGLLNVDKIYGKTLVNLSKFTSLTTTDLKYYTNLLDNTLIQNRIVTIINNTGRNIKVVVVNSTTGSFLREIPCNSQITNISTLGANESLSYFNGYKSDGWSEANKNDLLKVMILDGTVNFVPSYFEGIKSVGEDNGNKIEISSIGKNLIDLTKYKASNDGDTVTINYGDNSITFTSNWFVMFVIDVEPNTDYYISAIRNNPGKNSNLINVYDEALTTVIGSPGNGNGVFHNTTYRKVAVVLYSSNGTATTATYKNVMFIKGIAQQEYISYKQDKSEISLVNYLREWDYLDGIKNMICRNSIQIILNNQSTISSNNTPNTLATVFYYYNPTNLSQGRVICDKLPSTDLFIQGDNIGKLEGIWSSGSSILFAVANSKTGITTTDTADQQVGKLKTWLQSNPLTVVYKTSTETTEPITSKLSLNSYNSGYLAINSGAINPTIDLSYPTNVGERVKSLENALSTTQNDLYSILKTAIRLADRELRMKAINLLTTETTTDLKNKINEILNIWK